MCSDEWRVPENERAEKKKAEGFNKGRWQGNFNNEMRIKETESLILFLLNRPYSINTGDPRPATTVCISSVVLIGG